MYSISGNIYQHYTPVLLAYICHTYGFYGYPKVRCKVVTGEIDVNKNMVKTESGAYKYSRGWVARVDGIVIYESIPIGSHQCYMITCMVYIISIDMVYIIIIIILIGYFISIDGVVWYIC